MAHPDEPRRPPQLTDRERAVLDIERAHPLHSSAKDRLISDRLGISPVRFYQVLGRVVSTEAALAADPMLVRRVRRLQCPPGSRAA